MDKRRETYGRVLSNKMDRTVVVEVATRRRHPRYQRVVTYKKKFKAHDKANACGVGDQVRLAKSRPFSKEKRWRVVEVISRVKKEVVEVKPMEIAEQ